MELTFFELIVFGSLSYIGYRIAARIWRWADIDSTVEEIKVVEKQFSKVAEFSDKHADVKDKKETIDSFIKH